ncbi:TPA: hypothetical protein ACXI4C_004386 [Pseudomonas aeruginosa]|uniref:hypothetical protein n=2 Tax=Pseudomonas TaxID=286 RepID=UPI0003BB4E2D|nr:hypothetical protein [Pseudomonas aeruginosa]ERW61318.1 hypothetical protein Q024_06365 [Pseudomonas aeruginosa BWHPSA011]ETV28791.1 hypothetical protein Q046_05708 [Pseudomonas aeruginosa BWHPSA041]EIU2716065.1 hypothetical protein [Pseudomonas aeruginosa]ETV55938.1 hypothetical protein Q042_05347 [Pseudomonas aeruginosa BWHPSA037]MBG3917594.1 hypothetical protein [Pseudomonas aeruginosa]
MMGKITFKPAGGELHVPGSVTYIREWYILRDGIEVGTIEAIIRDLNQDLANPGYSVTVTATAKGLENSFHRNSNTFSNRSIRVARSNRSSYVRAAKQWAQKGMARTN